MILRALACVLWLAALTMAHVTLIYPAARYPPLDFLDTARTVGHCGMDRPKNPLFTEFKVGKPYNLTWMSNNPHKGGIRITLLDVDGAIAKRLTGHDDEGWIDMKDNSLASSVITFDEPCPDCVLQIERQALEYGQSYLFHSCADVHITETPEANDDTICSGNGRLTPSGECVCHKQFMGEACQYHVDCHFDSDCNGGKCLRAPRPSLVQKTCFCPFGFFGRNCETEFKNEDINDLCFNYENLVDTNSPRFGKYGLFDADCYDAKKLNGDDTIFSRVIGNEVEVILDFNTAAWIAIGWRPLKLDPSCRLFPELGLPRSRTFRQTAGSAPDRQRNGFFASALRAPLHPMDCTDMVMAQVVDGRSRVVDSYSRDRSTPLADTFFEGENSLTAAFGAQRDGRTIVMFRRNIREIEPSDHPLGPGKIMGVWAKGTAGADDIAYHGARNRGSVVFEFVKPNFMPVDGPLVYWKDGSTARPTLSIAAHAEPSTPHFVDQSPEARPEPVAVTPVHARTLDFSADMQVVDSVTSTEPQPVPEPEPEPEPAAPARPDTNTSPVASQPISKPTKTPTNEFLQQESATGAFSVSILLLFLPCIAFLLRTPAFK